jgi:CrcB protein
MLKDILIVGMGSFLGGVLRFLVSKGLAAVAMVAFPWGTFTVNIVGCLLIGFLSALPSSGTVISPATRLLLTTGFCGGFTTFSTFMNENASMAKDGQMVTMALYVSASIFLGFVAVLAGQWLSRQW